MGSTLLARVTGPTLMALLGCPLPTVTQLFIQTPRRYLATRRCGHCQSRLAVREYLVENDQSFLDRITMVPHEKHLPIGGGCSVLWKHGLFSLLCCRKSMSSSLGSMPPPSSLLLGSATAPG